MLSKSGSRRKFAYLVALSLSVTLIMTACSSNEDTTPVLAGAVVPTRVATNTPTATITSTPTTEPTTTSTPTATNTPTSTSSPTTTPSPTATETASPTPTFTSEPPTAIATSGIELSLPTQATISVSLPGTQPVEVYDPQTIVIDGFTFDYTGTLTNTNYQIFFVFSAQAGDIIDVGLNRTSGDLDPLVMILNSDDETLVENDDDPEGGTRNAYLEGFEVPEDGEYTIVATRFQRNLGTSQGNYEFYFDQYEGNGIVTNTQVPPVTDTELVYGDVSVGDISDSQHTIEFTFEGEAGDIVTISMEHTDGDLDPLLILANSNGDALIQDDDGGGNRNSLIENFTLPRTGTYIIYATRFQQQLGTTTGRFRLQLEVTVNGT